LLHDAGEHVRDQPGIGDDSNDGGPSTVRPCQAPGDDRRSSAGSVSVQQNRVDLKLPSTDSVKAVGHHRTDAGRQRLAAAGKIGVVC